MDFLSGAILNAHSGDAAQQGFYKACKTAKAQKSAGMQSRYPYHLKKFCTTCWKNSGFYKWGDVLHLSMARGIDPIRVCLPSHLVDLPADSSVEMRLVWDRAGSRYNWHLVVEDWGDPVKAPGNAAAAVDLGEVHPAVVTDGVEGMVFSMWDPVHQQEGSRVSIHPCKKRTALPPLQAYYRPQDSLSGQTKAQENGY